MPEVGASLVSKLSQFYNSRRGHGTNSNIQEIYRGPVIGNDDGVPSYESNLSQAIKDAQKKVPELKSVDSFSSMFAQLTIYGIMGGAVAGGALAELFPEIQRYLVEHTGQLGALAPIILGAAIAGEAVVYVGRKAVGDDIKTTQQELSEQDQEMQHALKKVEAGGTYLENFFQSVAKKTGVNYSRPDSEKLEHDMAEVYQSIRDFADGKRNNYQVITPGSRLWSYKIETRN